MEEKLRPHYQYYLNYLPPPLLRPQLLQIKRWGRKLGALLCVTCVVGVSDTGKEVMQAC